MTTLTPTPKQQFLDANGNPLAGGKVYTYAAGTTTPLVTYTDESGTTPNTNPVILDSRGEAGIWLGVASYKLKLTTATDVEIWTVDNIVSASVQALADLSESGGSALVGYLPAGTGAVATTVQAKLREMVSVKDFGAKGDGVTDDTAAMTAAHATGKVVFYPKGDYKFSTISFSGGGLIGEGQSTSLLSTSASTADLITFTGVGTGASTGDAVPYFANFYISVPTYSTKSAGAAIRLTPSQANPSNNVLFFPYFENIHIRNVPSGIVWDNTALVTVKDCKFFFYTGTAISSANTNAPDQGDNHIYGNTFYNGLGFNQGTALYIPSGGGLYFTNNKINGGLKGVHVKPLFTGSTSIFNIAANSIENVSTGYGVHFEYGNANAGVQVSQAQITGNQFANNNYSVFFDNGAGTAFYWSTVSITGNTFLSNASGDQPITLQSGRNFCISGNTFDKTGGVGGTAITIGSLAAEGKILQNSRYACTTYVSNSSSSVFIQPDVLTGSGTTTATNTGYGTALFVSPGNAVTFARQFESAPIVQVGLQQGAGAAVSAYSGSVAATGFTVYGVTHTTAVVVTYNYVAQGILRSY